MFVCSYYSVDIQQLKLASRRQSFSKIRAIIAWLAKEFDVASFKQVATRFDRDATGLVRLVNKLEVVSKNKNELYSLKELINKSVCQA